MIITPNGHNIFIMFSALPHIQGIYLIDYYQAFETLSKDSLAITENIQKKQH